MDFGSVLPIIGPASGWAAFMALSIYVVRGYQTGSTVSRREADAITKRAEAAEAERASLVAQNNELMEMARLGRTFFDTLNERVSER